ncbi:nucleotidyltransferase domain-containing protein [Nocardioides carbamazepini]|uniref:nucleotidyltransferase domain-containing protein n=1 Tax=Nocardioides carbamazepini TaxID=2854259 RepID=UPI00214A1DF3|nr:nucleotidyltransferase domain-containing protein [Nocardioides carbamazepini]MCR1782111.1 nucleotidyltransferase domain-containing protein [Nocardioides carbamazepini]
MHAHMEFLDRLTPILQRDERIVGLGLSGSMADGTADEHSDVDLVVVLRDEAYDEVMADRLGLLRSWTSFVDGFTGEHVGEPRLIIALVGPPLLHVDFKFVRISDVADRVGDPVVVWERDGTVARALAAQPPARERYDAPWVEDRFWTWIHYGATKLARGELFEVIGFLGFLREVVYGPLAAELTGTGPRGVRRIEAFAPDLASDLRSTVSGYDAAEAAAALTACVDIYLSWTARLATPPRRNELAARLVGDFLRGVVGQLERD